MNTTGNLNRARLREEATRRQEARASRSAVAQIEVLDQRLGQGVGAVRERRRLSATKKSRQSKQG